MLGLSGLIPRRELLAPYKLDWQTALRPLAALTVLVLGYSFFQLIRTARVERVVRAMKQISEKRSGHRLFPKKCSNMLILLNKNPAVEIE